MSCHERTLEDILVCEVPFSIYCNSGYEHPLDDLTVANTLTGLVFRNRMDGPKNR